MPPAENAHIPVAPLRAFFLLILLCLLIYCNSLHAAWHFDDYQNILENRSIQIDRLDPQTLKKALTHPSGAKIDRPLAFLSFALNWYVGQDDVFGYHLVNVAIHCLNAAILFLTILSIFRTPAMRSRDAANPHFIALLAAALWAVNPIHTQAVTYIVQRMACLAALFYLLGLYCYLRARLTVRPKTRAALLVGTGICFLLGLGSKEIVLTLPLAILLAEASFFQDLADPRTRKRLWVGCAAGGLVVIGLGLLLFLGDDPMAVFSGYGDRPFTLAQRLMSQPRVLVFYLSQLFYPIPTRLSLEHDLIVSTSLLHPWTTLPAMLIVTALVVAGFLLIRSKPLFGFSLLFFFLNHLIESSIIPLELVFEHRNYLPSMFLFVPVAAGLQWLLDTYHQRNRQLYYLLVAFVVLLIVSLGVGTFVRNRVWQTEYALWSDAARKAPGLNRPLHNLAWTHYERIGRPDIAIELYRQAAGLKVQRPSHRAMSLNNIALIHFRAGDFEAAERTMRRALRIAPGIDILRYRMALILAERQRWPQAMKQLDPLLRRHPTRFDYRLLKGNIYLRQGRPRQALAAFRQCLRRYPDRAEAAHHAAVALTAIGAYDRAEVLFQYALHLAPNRPITLLRLVDLNAKTGDNIDGYRYLRAFFAATSFDDMAAVFAEYADQPYADAGPDSALALAIGREMDRRKAGMLAGERFP